MGAVRSIESYRLRPFELEPDKPRCWTPARRSPLRPAAN